MISNWKQDLVKRAAELFASLARAKRAQPEAGQLVIPDKVLFLAGLGVIDNTFA